VPSLPDTLPKPKRVSVLGRVPPVGGRQHNCREEIIQCRGPDRRLPHRHSPPRPALKIERRRRKWLGESQRPDKDLPVVCSQFSLYHDRVVSIVSIKFAHKLVCFACLCLCPTQLECTFRKVNASAHLDTFIVLG